MRASSDRTDSSPLKQPRSLLIFGAGASFGSQSIDRPPLGVDLYHRLKEFDPDGWGALPDDLAVKFGEDFERGMLAMVTTVHSKLAMRCQLRMAEFFFRFRPTGGNAYTRLGRKLNRKLDKAGLSEIAFATTNYECLLMRAFKVVGITSAIGPVGPKTIEVCLPHGICNAFSDYPISIKESANMVFSSPEYSMLGGSFRLVDSAAEFEAMIAKGLPPAMSYFEPGKRTFNGGDWISEQRTRYSDLAMNARRIAIIGLRINEADSHIWTPIAQSEASVLYCGGGDGPHFLDWVGRNRHGKPSRTTEKPFFATALEEIVEFVSA